MHIFDMSFVNEHTHRHGVTPVITFDQPLWWKASMILQGEPKDSDLRKIVLRLGGLHAQMSFLGTIGHLMAGSGLHEVLDLIYASKAVDHILSGKAIARAVRAHLLVDAALNTLLASKAFNVDLAQCHYETYMEYDCEVEIPNDNEMKDVLEEGLPLSDGDECLL